MAILARIIAAALAILLFAPPPDASAAIEPRLRTRLDGLAPDEEVSVIAVFTAQADLDSFHRSVLETRSLSPAARRGHRRALIGALKEAATGSQGPLADFLRARGAGKLTPLWIVNALGVTARRDLIDAIEAWPGVTEVRLNGSMRLPPTPAAPQAAAEWNLDAIGAPEVWGLGFTGQGVVVATLDSGVDVLHEDLGPRWRGGTNSWLDPYGEHTDQPYDADGHGTAVMGVLVGGEAGGTAIGAAPGASWISAKIFNDAGVAEDLRVHEAFQWLLDPDGDPDTDDAPDVVNGSWGLSDLPGVCDTRFSADVQALRAAGVAAVFSAGNSGDLPETSLSPANYPESLAAGSIDQTLRVSRFSARGPSACDGTIFPEVVAPGAGIATADLTFGLFPTARAIVSGTSFAAPHVAGAIALLSSALPGRSAVALEAALRVTATDLGPAGADNAAGSGLINVPAAHDYLNVPDATPLIAVLPSPAAFHFRAVPVGGSSTARFSIVNAGSSDLLLGALAVGGTDAAAFSLLDDLCSGGTLAPSESCAFDIRVSPLGAGRVSALLAIPSNDPSTPEVGVPLDANALTAIGAWRSGAWYLDDGDGVWNAALDAVHPGFGAPGDVPVTGDWDGDGVTQIGAWRAGTWFLDDGDGAWNAALDSMHSGFGAPGDVPVTGDWDGDGATEIGAWRSGTWFLDDGDGVWNAALDTVHHGFGAPGDTPVTGDWDGDRRTDIGAWRSGTWYLDDGDGVWDGTLDTVRQAFGIRGDVPVTGDWDGDGVTEIGIWRRGAWFLDDGDGRWSADDDTLLRGFGAADDLPVTGCWP